MLKAKTTSIVLDVRGRLLEGFYHIDGGMLTSLPAQGFAQ